MKIGYVIAAYFGRRDNSNQKYSNDFLFYIKTHLDLINKFKLDIHKIYVVCTSDLGEATMVHATDYLQHLQNIDDRVSVINRENTGGSYCSWKAALDTDNNECDYMLLLEDDYIIASKKSIEYALEYWNEQPELLYLCQMWTDVPYQGIPNHAAISNGMLNNKLYNKLRTENNINFKLEYGSDKNAMFNNQAQFLEDFRLCGSLIMDIREKYSSLFNGDKELVIEYGNPNGECIFIPIADKFF